MPTEVRALRISTQEASVSLNLELYKEHPNGSSGNGEANIIQPHREHSAPERNNRADFTHNRDES